MMKNLLSILMIGACAIFTAQDANAQQACTPSAQYADSVPGIYPDSATFRSWSWKGHAGEAYSRSLTVKLPGDTTVDYPALGGPITLRVNYMRLDSLKMLMGGDTVNVSAINFTTACYPANCTWDSSAMGCIQLTGNPTLAEVGVYPLIAYVTANVNHILLGTFNAPQSKITNYVLEIDNKLGVETLDMNKFMVGQNIPNPANGTTAISFTTPTQSTVDFKVYNMLGMVVKSQKIDAVSGLNKINLNTNEFAQGVYVYSLTNGNTTLTKRMVVAGK